MNKKILAVLAGATLAAGASALAQTSSSQPASSQSPPPTSPQATGASQSNPTGTNGPREDALNSGSAGNQAGLSGNGSKSFESLDKSNRGYLRETDVASNKKLTANFKACDSNHDGKLDRDEYNACVNAGMTDKY